MDLTPHRFGACRPYGFKSCHQMDADACRYWDDKPGIQKVAVEYSPQDYKMRLQLRSWICRIVDNYQIAAGICSGIRVVGKMVCR